MLETIGTVFAVVGAVLSVIGALYNNLFLNHRKAMQIWMISNILFITWSGGFLLGLWNGGISIGALFCSYCVYAISNAYGLLKMRRNG